MIKLATSGRGEPGGNIPPGFNGYPPSRSIQYFPAGMANLTEKVKKRGKRLNNKESRLKF